MRRVGVRVRLRIELEHRVKGDLGRDRVLVRARIRVGVKARVRVTVRVRVRVTIRDR